MLERNRRWSIATLVFVGHVLLLILLDESVREEPRAAAESRRSLLFFIKPPQQTVHPPIEISPDPSATAELRPPISVLPPALATEKPATAQTRPPLINWRQEAAAAAGNTIRAKQAADALRFSEASKAPAKKCVRPKAPQWRKETPTYGFSGGLPYVRFYDNRCVFVVIFFACGFGAKPQADSHLLDDMHNYPNDSSVPDLDECEEPP